MHVVPMTTATPSVPIPGHINITRHPPATSTVAIPKPPTHPPITYANMIPSPAPNLVAHPHTNIGQHNHANLWNPTPTPAVVLPQSPSNGPGRVTFDPTATDPTMHRKQKKKASRRSTIYTSRRHSAMHHAISPWNKQYKKGCNTYVRDIDAGSEHSSSSASTNSSASPAPHPAKIFYDHTVNSSAQQLAPKLLKRQSLPSTTTWNGKTTTLEKYKALFLGHVDQQTGMGYLLHPDTIRLWLTMGDEDDVLHQLRILKVHPYIQYITPIQFSLDIQWVHGALRQSILLNGSAIIDKHSPTKDGIAAWKELFDTHEYAGDPDVYLLQQMDALHVEYHPTYPGGPLQFL